MPECDPLEKQAGSVGRVHPKRDRRACPIVLGNLGELITRKGDPAAAEPIFVDALANGLRVFGDQNQDVAKLRSKYGSCLIQLKKFDQAEGELLAALPVLRDSLGGQNDATQTLIGRLVELYEAWGKEEEALKYRALLSSANK